MIRIIILFLIISMFSFANDNFLILAHRGASQIFPENTMLSMRGALGTEAADYLEMDLQLTKDYVLVVFHDKYLNDVTDVKKKFTKHRARKDGKYYVVDFTYAELQNLKITSRYYKILGFRKNLTKFRNYEKYYTNKDNRIPSFQEVIDLTKAYNKAKKVNVGLYPELKDLDFYRRENRDVTMELVEVLKSNGYKNKKDNIIIQSFYIDELQRLKERIFPEYNVEYKTTYLVDTKAENKILKDKTGNVLSYIKENIDCLGISKNKIYGSKKSQEFLNKLKTNNMCIHVYTFNKENVSRGFKTLDEEILYFKENLKVNGIFKD